MSKNPDRLLRKLRTAINKNMRDILINQRGTIFPGVPKKHLPANTYLRELYNQAYYCYYANMLDASISLTCVCFEKMTRDLYKKMISSDKDKSWDTLINELVKHIKADSSITDKPALLEFLKNMKYIKDDTRNRLLHGKIDSYVEDTKLVHRAMNVNTLNWEELELAYTPQVHNFGKIKQEKTEIASRRLLIYLSICIIYFNAYLDLKPIYR